jgi:RNA polymerase sigma-70 factor, ECF subfamily
LNQKAAFCDYNNEESKCEPDIIPDDIILCRVADKDETAFSELYQRYSKPLYNYLHHLIYEEAIAEDLLQEVFLAVWEGARRYRGQAKVKTWIYQIAHYKAVSWLRRNGHPFQSIYSKDVVSGENLEAELVESMRRKQIQSALNRLSLDHREVVELAFFHDMSYVDIAKVMSCPIGTVKSRMSYARKHLNQILRESGILGTDNKIEG